LPTMRPDWKGVGKFNLGATSGQKARRQLALMGDIDLSGVKGSAAAAPAAGAETAAKPPSEGYQKLTGSFLNRFRAGEDVQDAGGLYKAAADAYKSMTPDEQKKIAAEVSKLPLAPKIRKILGIKFDPSTHKLEQVDLSLEDLIKEELLRVLNEEE